MTNRRALQVDLVEPIDEDRPLFPQVAAAIGVDAATGLSRVLGGRRIYIPRVAGPNHPLAQGAGDAAAAVICGMLSGRFLDVPLTAGKRARILELSRAGRRRADVASIVGCTERHVYQVLAEASACDDQADLFADL